MKSKIKLLDLTNDVVPEPQIQKPVEIPETDDILKIKQMISTQISLPTLKREYMWGQFDFNDIKI